MLPPSSSTAAVAVHCSSAPAGDALPVARAGPAAAIESAAVPERARRERRLLVALMSVIAAGCLISAAAVALSLALGESWKEALRSTSLLQVHRLRLQGGMDSWGPMWAGLARQRAAAGAGAGARLGASSPYEQALRLDRCKFQYPPSSWLLLEMLPEPAGAPLSCVDGGTPGADIHSAAWPAKPWLALASAFACLGLVAVSMAVLRRTLASVATAPPGASPAADGASPTEGHLGRLSWTARAPLWIGAALAGLCFYPLIKGHTLGQLQVFINLALGAALLLWPRRPRVSGVLVGLCCLFKPQYLLFLGWGLLRRRWSFAAALATVAVAGHGLALARYGLEVHLHYLQLLQGLAQVGEVFWANQSANGVLNRLLQTGDAVAWAPAAFPAYHPLVRWGTFASSLALLLAAIWPRRAATSAAEVDRPLSVASVDSRDARGARNSPHSSVDALDFAAMLAAVTIASPIAWEHHYGSFLPIFALLAGVLATQPRWPAASALVLGASFVAMSHAVLRPEWIFVGPLAGIAGSHLWLGALALFGLLLAWRARPASTPAAAAAAAAGGPA
ncbi:MAG: DUF2029 domain-containing protein [Burkholderiales bacterium]|nr:DUF2029 domain-containing protein [Burkholderiales bacterium]